MIKRLLILSLLLSAISLQACREEPLSEDKFIKVYTDLVIAQDTVSRYTPLTQVKKAVFAKNGITEKEYNITLNYYNEDPQKWEAVLDKAIAYLEKQKKK